ncbi:MAG: single-stranded DNA-binding protein [Rickettsiales bacterium]
MAGSLNKVMLIGNVGKDPEIRTTQEGKEIAQIVLATSEHWKDKNTGEKREKTEWHRVVVFSDGLVNVIKNYIKKGSKIFVEGSLQTRKWEDSSGQEKYTTEVVIQGFNGSITMLDSRSNDRNESRNSQSLEEDKAPFSHENLDDDIPF